VLLWLFRGVFGVLVISMAMITFRYVGDDPELTYQAWIAFFGILGVGLLVVVTDVLIRDKQITTISAVYFGLLLGLLIGNILSTALEPFLFEWDSVRGDPSQAVRIHVEKGAGAEPTLRLTPVAPHPVARSAQGQRKAFVTLLITAFCCYITISTLLQTK